MISSFKISLMRFLKLLVLFGFINQISACNRVQEINNYDDCILHHMRNVSSDMAARAIGEACSNKFGDPEISKPVSS